MPKVQKPLLEQTKKKKGEKEMSLHYLAPFFVLILAGAILIESIDQDSRHDFCLEKGFDRLSDAPTSDFYCEKIKWYCEGEICVQDGYTSKEFRDREYEVWKIKKNQNGGI